LSIGAPIDMPLAGRRVLVTGASGFIGQAIARKLAGCGATLSLLGGSRAPDLPPGDHKSIALGALETASDLGAVVVGADCVVHAAGLAHRKDGAEERQALFAANTLAVERICGAMRSEGVRRFILISSIAAKDPVNDYGHSKRAGEDAALGAMADGGERVIVRPPLVYGVGAPGNLASLRRLIALRLPLPFASIGNRRSLCAVDNLAEAVAKIVAAQGRSGIYEICDDDAVSLPQIIRALGDGMGLAPKLFPFPRALLATGLGLVSRSMAAGLFGDLMLDNAPLKRDFHWSPPIRTLDGLRAIGA
jgi:nucleoside-diphosphate-sugar epimerase